MPHKLLVPDARHFDGCSGDFWPFEELGADTALGGEHGWFPQRSSSQKSLLERNVFLSKCTQAGWKCEFEMSLGQGFPAAMLLMHLSPTRSPVGPPSLLCHLSQYRRFTTLPK